MKFLRSALIFLGGLTAFAEAIDVPLPVDSVRAHLDDPGKPLPVVSEEPLTATVALRRGVFRVTASFRSNDKLDQFRDYGDMPVFLRVSATSGKAASAVSSAPIRSIVRKQELVVDRFVVEEGPAQVQIQCVERAETPYGTPAEQDQRFRRRMKRVKERMAWTADGRELPETGTLDGQESDGEDLDGLELEGGDRTPAVIDATQAQIPMVLLADVTIEKVDELPAAREVAPFQISVDAPARLPEGAGRFKVTARVSAADSSSASAPGDGKLSLAATLTDRRGRIFRQQKIALDDLSDGTADLAFEVAHPDLPPGMYLINAVVEKADGTPVEQLPAVPDALRQHFLRNTRGSSSNALPTAAVRRPIARMQSYAEYGRELLWGFWGNFYDAEDEAKVLRDIGINVGFGPDYRFPYRWRYDQAGWTPFGDWPEDIIDNRLTQSYYQQSSAWIQDDPGAAVVDLWDELSMSPYVNETELRRDMLRIWRVPRKWPTPISTLSEYNNKSGNDCLSWDEVGRAGFPGHGSAANQLRWSEKAFEYDNLGMRIEVLRHMNPFLNASSGQGAGHDQHFFDSMHDRVYPWTATLDCYASFVQAVPRYGITPWTWLINLSPQSSEQCSHMIWSALAAGGRFLPLYSVGDHFGRFMVHKQGSQKGSLTKEGQWLAESIARVQPLSPVLMSVRNRLTPEVLFWDPYYYRPNDGVLEGLLANGVQPEVGRDPGGRKLVVLHGSSVGGQDYSAVLEAAEKGAHVFMTAETDNGGNAAKAFGLTLTGQDDLVLAEGADSLPAEFKTAVHRRVDKAEIPIDLSPLAEFLPGVDGLVIQAQPGPAGRLAPESPLKRVMTKDRKTLAYAGSYGKGRVIFLNVHLPKPGKPPSQARNRSAHGALMRAVLEWAGVEGAFRCTVPAENTIHPGVLGVELSTKDGSQSYVLLVPENDADIAFRPTSDDVEAVRDLCTSQTLPWRNDATGRYVDVHLKKGKGTLLALLNSVADGKLEVIPAVSNSPLPAGEVTGGQTLYVGVRPALDSARAPTARTYQLTVRGPQGETVPGLTDWATGVGTVVLRLPVAISDLEGEWKLDVQDMTTGATGSATILKRGGYRSDDPPVQLQEMAQKLGVEPAPFTLELDAPPKLEGDIIIGSIKGRVESRRSDAEATVSVVIPEEYLLAGNSSTKFRLKPGAATPFEFTFCMHREQFLALHAGFDYRNEGIQTGLTRLSRDPGIPVRLSVEGAVVLRQRWAPDILNWMRKPDRISSQRGGKLRVAVQNATDRPHDVQLRSAGREAWQAGGLDAHHRLLPGQSRMFEKEVRVDDRSRLDPGYHWLPLALTVDKTRIDGASLFVEEYVEQRWWCRFKPLSGGTPGDLAVETAPELGLLSEPPSESLAQTAEEAVAAGWSPIDTRSVIRWERVAAAAGGVENAGSVLAATRVLTPSQCALRVGFVGGRAPDGVWVNGNLVEMDWSELGTGGTCSDAIAFREGLNTVILSVELPIEEGDATSLVLRNPETDARNRALTIGAKNRSKRRN